MIKDLIDYFKDKKILILGYGREGASTYKLIRKYLKDQMLYIADAKENFQDSKDELKEDKNVKCISGENYLDNLNDYDIIMKSPGIPFVGIDISKFEDKIKSQLELLLEFFPNFTIGVTGTKGKSTTSSLIYQMLKDQGRNTVFLGNIGVPAFDYIEELKEDSVIVLEMSSHQLEFMKVSPNISILLNIFEEHLDHYESYLGYVEAKCNIFKNQKENDYILYNYDCEILNEQIKSAKGKVYRVSFKGAKNSTIYMESDGFYLNGKKLYDKNEKRNLLGDYSLNNIMFVLGVSEILELDLRKTADTINSFKPLRHRLEFIGKYADILFYDNSIATIPQATIEAVKALKDVNTLIIGGMDRGIDYTSLIDFLNEGNVKNVICMPKTGHDIAKKLNKEITYVVDTLEEAVNTSKDVTEKGKICLLSPAAASYGFFKNFEEKGDKFKELVEKLK